MVGENERVVGLRCGVIGSGDPEQERPTPDRLRHELAILAANALDCAVLCGDGVVGESESNARQCRQFGEKVGHHDDRGLFMKSPSFLLYVDEIRRRGTTTMKVVEEGLLGPMRSSDLVEQRVMRCPVGISSVQPFCQQHRNT